MINNILNSVLNKASNELSSAKDKVLAASKKRAQEQFDSNIPSPQSFKAELESLATGDPDNYLKAQQVYNKTVSILEKAIQKLERSKDELEGIKFKLDEVKNRLEFFNEIVSFFDPLIMTLKALPTVIDGILASQVTPIVSGTVIDKAGELKKSVKDNVKKFDDGFETFPKAEEFFDKEIRKIMGPLNKGIEAIQSSIDALSAILNQIIALFGSYFEAQNLPELQDTTTGDQDTNTPLGGITLQEYLSNPDNLSNIVEDLIIPARKRYYEVRDNGPGTDLLETGIIEEPIN